MKAKMTMRSGCSGEGERNRMQGAWAARSTRLKRELDEARQAMLDGRGLEAEMQRQLEEKLARERRSASSTRRRWRCAHRQARPVQGLGGVARYVGGGREASAS